MIEKHSNEQAHLKVEPKSFSCEFLNSGVHCIFHVLPIPTTRDGPLYEWSHDLRLFAGGCPGFSRASSVEETMI